jgi:GIY-YIG catalytic domain-containing protein
MNKYEKGKIYKITNTIDNEIYVGSTCKSLQTRFNEHRKTKRKCKVHKHLESICWVNTSIELIENYPCYTQKELLIREDHYIQTLKPTLNSRRAYILIEPEPILPKINSLDLHVAGLDGWGMSYIECISAHREINLESIQNVITNSNKKNRKIAPRKGTKRKCSKMRKGGRNTQMQETVFQEKDKPQGEFIEKEKTKHLRARLMRVYGPPKGLMLNHN